MTGDDMALVRAFVENRSEPAFTALVERHIGLVYSAAVRQVQDAHTAQEVAQTVFIQLARKAASLGPGTVVSAWLYRTTLYTAADVRKARRRRALREQEAGVQAMSNPTESDAWAQVAPLLDDALADLGEADRAALVLRYFENKTAREIAIALRTEEGAAQKRVTRALEKLRGIFAKRGVTLTAAALSGIVAANAVQAAPAGLTATISTAALATSTLATTLAMTLLQKITVTAALTVTIGTGIYVAKQASVARAQAQQQAVLAAQADELAQERDAATNRIAALTDAMAKQKNQDDELSRLRSVAKQSRAMANMENDPAFLKAHEWLAKEAKLRQLLVDHPDQAIPELKFLSEDEWFEQARRAELDSVKGMRLAFINLRASAVYDFGNKLSAALKAYQTANNQQLPGSVMDLSGYFSPPVADLDTILPRYRMLTAEEQANPASHGAAIILDTIEDPSESKPVISSQMVSTLPRPMWPSIMPDELKPLVKAYNDANPQMHGFLSIYDLQPYASTPEEKTAMANVIKTATQNTLR